MAEGFVEENDSDIVAVVSVLQEVLVVTNPTNQQNQLTGGNFQIYLTARSLVSHETS